MATPEQELTNLIIHRPEQILVVSGTGVSCATVADASGSCATWTGLLRHGIQWCKDNCPNRPSTWDSIVESLIETGRVRDLIAAAGMIKRELSSVHDGEFGKWLQDSIGRLHVHDDRTIKALGTLGVRLATTNYDALHEHVLKIPAYTWQQPELVQRILLGDERAVFHIHGHYREARSIVLDAESYEHVCTNIETQTFLRAACALNSIVFVGCGDGLQDPNFGSLFAFISAALRKTHGRHFHLIRADDVKDVARRYSEENLPIRATAYGRNYGDLPAFLEKLATLAETQRSVDPLFGLRQSQEAYEFELSNLRTQFGGSKSAEFLRKGFELNRCLGNAGGTRAAAWNMQSLFHQNATELSLDELLMFGLEAVEKLLDVGYTDAASQIFHILEVRLQGQSPPAEYRDRFHTLRTKSFSAAGRFEHAIQAIEEARQESTSVDCTIFDAQLAELRFLRGDLDEVLTDQTRGERE